METEGTMSRLKAWLLDIALPIWAKESLKKDNEKLRNMIKELEMENARLRAYAAGLEYGLKRRITIRNEVSR